MNGRFIAFEGGDASGKTTQAQRVAHILGAVFTREPGGTELGERLRALVLDPDHPVDVRAEALMIAAARAQHTSEVIGPALAAGTDVVTDRFTASSLAYQGGGSGLDRGAVAALSSFATGGLEPEVTVLIDVPVRVALARLDSTPDRFESEDMDFHERVRAVYLDLAAGAPETWLVIDGDAGLDEVSARVDAALAPWMTSR